MKSMPVDYRQPDFPRGDAARWGPPRPTGCARWGLVAVVAVVLALGAGRPAGGQDVEVLLPERECQVKYALLYSFGLLTNWPREAFEPPETGPFVIGVLGGKPYPEYLARIAETKKIQGRSIVIRRFKGPEEIGRCHILYVTNAVSLEVEQAALQKLVDQPVLVVSENPNAAGTKPATIQFVIEQGAVKFLLSAETAKAHQLQIDPRLLKLAKPVSSQR